MARRISNGGLLAVAVLLIAVVLGKDWAFRHQEGAASHMDDNVGFFRTGATILSKGPDVTIWEITCIISIDRCASRGALICPEGFVQVDLGHRVAPKVLVGSIRKPGTLFAMKIECAA